jgi:hypothetical protein
VIEVASFWQVSSLNIGDFKPELGGRVAAGALCRRRHTIQAFAIPANRAARLAAARLPRTDGSVAVFSRLKPDFADIRLPFSAGRCLINVLGQLFEIRRANNI